MVSDCVSAGKEFEHPSATKVRIEGENFRYPHALHEDKRCTVGDTTGAIRAYEHYLTLRTNPDSPLVPQRDSVVAELGELVR